MKILIVEDEEDIREIITEFLSILGIPYVSVSNGKDAMKEIENNVFDVVFTDLKLPDIYGTVIIEEIRKRSSKTIITAISGFTDRGTKDKVFQAGANYYLEKPFSLKELEEIIKMAE